MLRLSQPGFRIPNISLQHPRSRFPGSGIGNPSSEVSSGIAASRVSRQENLRFLGLPVSRTVYLQRIVKWVPTEMVAQSQEKERRTTPCLCRSNLLCRKPPGSPGPLPPWDPRLPAWRCDIASRDAGLAPLNALRAAGPYFGNFPRASGGSIGRLEVREDSCRHIFGNSLGDAQLTLFCGFCVRVRKA